MGIKARLGAGQWDILFCQDCERSWSGEDVSLEWTDEPEQGGIECPGCHSRKVVREERG